ncbi:Acetylcholinesterase [Trichoplax sp. H2]|nr:Acetylcholinesterase [Trichoplax sp. H2]|eukprot:RDD40157.1 Acetylcholinesterase [Trichoplax sp. H2]
MACLLRNLIIIKMILLSLAVHLDATKDDSITINISNGPIQGKKQVILDKTIYSFKGIPFAQPPIGSLRYQRPVPYESKWEKPLPCFQYKSTCSQYRSPTSFFDRSNPNGPEMKISEDCLYLDVFTPTTKSSDQLPVIVWVHGGSLLHGDGSWWHGQTLSSYENVIVVLINYRLGSFGFLAARNAAHKVLIEPNVGFYDQALALKWVQANIASFGGNPNNVLLSGHSAGSISISYHLTSPVSRGLFHSVAMFSGTNMMMNAYYTKWEQLDGAFTKFLSKTSCNNTKNSVEESVECLRKLSEDELQTAQLEIRNLDPYLFRPAVDKQFIPDDPKVLLYKGLINPMEKVLISTVQNDGAVMTSSLPGYNAGFSRESFVQITKLPFIPDSLHSLIVHEYTNYTDINNPIGNRCQLDRLATHALFQVPAAYLAGQLATHNYSPYMMLFDQFTVGSAYFPPAAGIIHQMEVPYIFGYPLHHPAYIKDTYTKDDVEVSKHMMGIMGGLARREKPMDIDDWRPYAQGDERYLLVRKDLQVEGNFIPAARNFWNKLLPSLVKSFQCNFESANTHNPQEDSRNKQEL